MSNDFDKNGYIHLKDFLDKDSCQELTQELNNYIAQGKTAKDDQCPLSEGIHGAPTFDKLLEDLLPHFEKASGKRLYPTYSYARLYKHGEELKNHRDRPACEISATLTLGWSGKQWAIYMGDDEDKSNATEIWMNVGDAVLYRGMEKWHWREKFEGEWQAQVFLHYVDADGPHSNEKYDGREALGSSYTSVKKENKNDNNEKDLVPYTVFENHLSSTYCDNTIKTILTTEGIQVLPPLIGKGKINKSIRDVERLLLPPNNGIGGVLTSVGLNANHYWWKYAVTHSQQSEFLIYKPDGHYNSHVDTQFKISNNTRKLSVIAFLNDDYEGGKFWINCDGNVEYPVQTKGTVIVFPSYIVHGVEPVTKGVRYSCVTWIEGPYFR